MGNQLKKKELLYSEKNILYLLTILECIEKVNLYTEPFENKDALFEAQEQANYNAVCHLLLAIGEESKKIEEILKDEIGFIAWEEIGGLRNRLAHDYRGIDPIVVFHVAKNELAPLKQACISMLKIIKVSPDKLKSYTETIWYRHLGYLNDL